MFSSELQILDVGRCAFIEDDEIDGRSLHSPVLLRPEQLVHDIQILHIADSQQHDRQSPESPAPQPGLAAGAASNRL
jgi:hypothetical protein